MLYCGICHSDCHIGLNHMAAWRPCHYPFVGGHELLGRVTEVGSKVTKVKVGEAVGVGCFVDACLNCENCKAGNENYCETGLVATYNADRKAEYGRYHGNPESKTWGGYSGSNVVNEHFILKIPENLPLEFSAPIMCAGITMYSPLRQHGATAGKKMTIGVIGIGGLGTMGIKIAAALGHDVVAISSSPHKEEAAKKKGATHFVVSSDPESVNKCAKSCDIILDTVSAPHGIDGYLPLLATGGVFVCLGINPQVAVSQVHLIRQRQTITGSMIGGIAPTQEVLDLCAKHQIWPDCELILASGLSAAWTQLCGPQGHKDGSRYVIDIKKSIAEGQVPAAEN
jgi:uncharacterized zinc-type alcohol dehydrogenase-like protein